MCRYGVIQHNEWVSGNCVSVRKCKEAKRMSKLGKWIRKKWSLYGSCLFSISRSLPLFLSVCVCVSTLQWDLAKQYCTCLWTLNPLTLSTPMIAWNTLKTLMVWLILTVTSSNLHTILYYMTKHLQIHTWMWLDGCG